MAVLPATNSIPRLVIGAAQGRSGKTTVSLGLCAALSARGLAVQPFKKGPDYIDPSWLSEAAGRSCCSLDPFFHHDGGALVDAFVSGSAGADIALVEGNHGLYDSLAEDGSGSTAALARQLDAPILLVINAARMGRSAAAMVHGYLTFEPSTPIAGVILNNVARGRHESKMRQAIEQHCGVPVLGALPRDEGLAIPDRHLGLVPRSEQQLRSEHDGLLPAFDACRQVVERHLDVSAILRIAQEAPALPRPLSLSPIPCSQFLIPSPRSPVPIAIFRDAAFTFYYPENLAALEAAGAELVYVDALRDRELPRADALVIGGGFPEMFMAELSANEAMRRAVREAATAGLPIYAECGGLMYLSRRIIWGEQSAEMVGVLPCDVEMTGRPQGHGYVEAVVDGDNPFFPVGSALRGHEFHNSRLVHVGEGMRTAYRLTRGNGMGDDLEGSKGSRDGGRDGLVLATVLASYTHLHAAGAPGWAAGLVERARQYSSRRGAPAPGPESASRRGAPACAPDQVPGEGR